MIARVTSDRKIMEGCYELAFRQHVLTGLAVPEGNAFAAMLIIKFPSGIQRASGVLGIFESPCEAKRFAIEYGIEQTEGQKALSSEVARAGES